MNALRKKTLIVATAILFWALSLALSPVSSAAEESDASGMRAEYDKINAIKMKKYDELMREITELQDRIAGLLVKAQKLEGEKKTAESVLAGSIHAAEIAGANVKKALEDASSEDESMRRFADAAAKESAGRREKIEKLKAGLKEANDKMKELQDLKNKKEAENAARDKEYKEALSQGAVLKEKKQAGPKSALGAETEETRLKTRISELEVKVQEEERLRQQLSEEILTSAEKIRTVGEEISALEGEDAVKAKELRAKIEDFDKAGKGDTRKDQSLEALKKTAQLADEKMLSEKTSLQTVEEDLKKISGEKVQAEQDLVKKTDELKVRISALIVQNKSDQELLPKETDPGEKNIKARLERAEKEVVELRRKTEEVVMADKLSKKRFDKEMLDKHFNLAVVYEMNGLYKDAEREYLACLKMDPEDADVHYNLAILYDDRLNDNKKAQKHY